MVLPQRQPVDELLNTKAAADRLGVAVETLRRYELAGRITSTRTPGGHRRFRASDIDALLEPTP
jgi:excisionase family DNA binding protein